MQAVLPVGVFVVVGVILWRRKAAEVPLRWRRLFDAGEIGVVVVATLYVLYVASRAVLHPIAWDFPVFYTVARNAATGLSFYDPTDLLATFVVIQEQAGVPDDWLAEFGFWYAPPTG